MTFGLRSLGAWLPNAGTVVRPTAPIVLSAQMLAFHVSGTTVRCWECNSSGAYVADIGDITTAIATSGLVERSRIVHDAAGSGMGLPVLMFNDTTSLTVGTKHIYVWDLANDEIVDISIPAPAGATTFGVGPPFVPPGESNGYLYFLVSNASTATGGGLKTQLWRAKMDGTGSQTVMVADIYQASGLGTSNTTVLFDSTHAYHGPHGAAPNEKLWAAPLLGPTSSETGVRAVLSGEPIVYYAGAVSGVDYWAGLAGRRQRRFVNDPGAAFIYTYADAFTLDAPYTDTNNRGLTINRSGNTSGYFPWNAGLSELKLGQPQGDTTASGHSTEAPKITMGSHPTHGLPHFVHLNQYTHSW